MHLTILGVLAISVHWCEEVPSVKRWFQRSELLHQGIQRPLGANGKHCIHTSWFVDCATLQTHSQTVQSIHNHYEERGYTSREVLRHND